MSETQMIVDNILVNPAGNLWEDPRIVVLKEKEGGRFLSIQVGPKEADAIAVILQDVSLPEPQTHDFVCAVIDTLGASVKSVKVHRFENAVFHARVSLILHGEQLGIDCRPSDALAIALRVDAPIFVNEKLLRKFGYSC